MPGLLRGVARTAVIAGTATAVSNRVSRRQANRWAAQDQQAYYQEQAYQQQAYQQPPANTQPQLPMQAPAPQPAPQQAYQMVQPPEVYDEDIPF